MTPRDFGKLLLITLVGSMLGATTINAQQKQFSDFKSGTAAVNGVKIYYRTGGAGEPLVLLHGFPETGEAWRKVAPVLAAKYTVIVPDLRGLGASEKAVSGYDRKTLAADIYQLMQKLGYKKFRVAGHDFGGSTAYALAAQYREAVPKVAIIEAFPPGLLPPEESQKLAQQAFGAKAWFAGFNQTKDLPEALTNGRERIYLNWLFDNFTVNKTAFPEAEREPYLQAYSAPKAMSTGFEYYRVSQIELANNLEFAKTKLKMPILAVGGDGSFGDVTFRAMQAAGENVRGVIIKNCGHFVPEEQPEELTKILLAFFAEENKID